MSERRSIGNTFVVNTLDEPVSVVVQYAPNNNPSSEQIHSTFTANDKYMRTRNSDETFSGNVDPNHPWNRIVGEGGGETNYTFNVSDLLTGVDGTTAYPAHLGYQVWQDAPVATTTTYPYLWSKVQKKDGNGNNVGSASYIRLTGEDGEDGDDGNGIVSITSTFGVSAYGSTANESTAPADISQWFDSEPTLTDAKPYLWKKEVTVFTDITKNTTKYYMIGKKGDKGDNGENGADGANAIQLDLSNQHEDFLYDDAGNVLAPTYTSSGQQVAGALSQATLYDGPDVVSSGVTWAINDTDDDVSWSNNTNTNAVATIFSNGLLTVSHLYADSVAIRVRATYDGKYYYDTFTANKTKHDIYMLKISPSAVSYNPASFSTVNLALSATRMNGKGGMTDITFGSYDNKSKISSMSAKGYLRLFVTGVLPVGSGIYDLITQQVTSTPFSVDANIASRNSSLYFELKRYNDYADANPIAVADYETVPIAKAQNGNDGNDAPYYIEQYARASSREVNNYGYPVGIDESIGTNGWLDTAPQTTDTYPYIWKRSRLYNPNTGVYGDWSYTCETGENGQNGVDGNDGKDGATLLLTPNPVMFDTDSDGNVESAQTATIYATLQLSDGTMTSSVTLSDLVDNTDVSGARISSNKIVYTLPTIYDENQTTASDFEGSVEVTATATINLVSYTARGSITIKANRRGETGIQGARGKAGRFYYYAGDWDDFASSSSFIVSDAQAPYFGYTSNGVLGYYVFNPTDNGTYTKSYIVNNYGNPSNNAPWEVMYDEFKYIITEAIFGNYAHFGGAIINGDWMISQYGYAKGFGDTKMQITSQSNTFYTHTDFNDILAEGSMYIQSEMMLYFTDGIDITSSSFIDIPSSAGGGSAVASCQLVEGNYYTLQIEDDSQTDGDTLYWQMTVYGYALHSGSLVTTEDPQVKSWIFKCTLSGTYTLQMRKGSGDNDLYVDTYNFRMAKFVPYRADDMRSGEIYAAGGNFRVSQNAVEVRGTVKADNFFHNVCYYLGGMVCINGGANVQKGGYTYNTSGNADIIEIIQSYLGQWDYGNVSGAYSSPQYYTILLPDPSTCEGKIVTVYSGVVWLTGKIAISCVTTNKMVVHWTVSSGKLLPYNTGTDPNPRDYIDIVAARFTEGHRLSNGWDGTIVVDQGLLEPVQYVFAAQKAANGLYYWFQIK